MPLLSIAQKLENLSTLIIPNLKDYIRATPEQKNANNYNHLLLSKDLEY